MRTVAAMVLIGGLAAEAGGQSGSSVGWGPESAYGRMFDPATVETIRGGVASVDLVNPRKGMACGVCLEVLVEGGPLHVHLGPESYLRRQALRIQGGDAIEVTGSRVIFKGEPVIIASRVRKGEETLVLRDARGVPAWSGWQRRRGSQPAPRR